MEMSREVKILSVQVGMPREMVHVGASDGAEQLWSSGIFKSAVQEPVWVSSTSLAGDGQADLKHHGGPDRVLLIYASEHYPGWSERFGLSLEPGAMGENLTIEGADETTTCLGDIWEAPGIRIEISQPRIPCFKLGRRLECKEIVGEVSRTARGGWYARVLREGTVQAGDRLRLIERPHPEWTIERAFRLFVFNQGEPADWNDLAQVRALSELWRSRLAERASG